MSLNKLSEVIHETSIEKGFWSDLDSQEFKVEHIYLVKLALIHSEVTEVLEAMRDDEWEKVPEEMADIIIRTLDLAAAMGYDLHDVVLEKVKKNKARPYKHNKAF